MSALGIWWNPATWFPPKEEPIKAISFRPILKLGDDGDDVKAIQIRLNELRYPVRITGKFDRDTAAYISIFQSNNGLKVDGIVGRETRLKLFGARDTATTTPQVVSQTSIFLLLLIAGALFFFRTD